MLFKKMKCLRLFRIQAKSVRVLSYGKITDLVEEQAEVTILLLVSPKQADLNVL